MEAVETQSAEMHALKPKIDGGASWFFWVAGLSLVNALATAFGSTWGFVIGLGFSQVLSAAAASANEADSTSLFVVAWAANIALLAGFAAIGWFARKPSALLFGIGLVIFALDTLIFLIAQDWMGVAFHGLALFFMWQGFSAARRHAQLATELAVRPSAPVIAPTL
jgi:hypothetical protein